LSPNRAAQRAAPPRQSAAHRRKPEAEALCGMLLARHPGGSLRSAVGKGHTGSDADMPHQPFAATPRWRERSDIVDETQGSKTFSLNTQPIRQRPILISGVVPDGLYSDLCISVHLWRRPATELEARMPALPKRPAHNRDGRSTIPQLLAGMTTALSLYW